ncbi:MAG: response regulator [Mucilaginibacter polytrichastri]|nr:response regulator [Mucilaginibacter polytrichastri]
MKKRVLILDDDTQILSVCEYILQELGYEVFTDTNCNLIIEKADKLKPDVILMDNWIPDTGGKEATRLLKNNAGTKDIPVIYFSANTDIKKLAEEAGADFYLSKPFDIVELENAVNKLAS